MTTRKSPKLTLRDRAIIGGLVVGVLATVPVWRSEVRGIARQVEAEKPQLAKPKSCGSGGSIAVSTGGAK
jgi:hypothetical protein